MVIELETMQLMLKPNAVISKTILEVFIEIMQKFSDEAERPLDYTLQSLEKINSQMKIKSFFYYPIYEKYFMIFNCHLLRLSLSKTDLSSFLIESINCSKESSLERTETALNLLILILFKNTSNFTDIVNDCECTRLEIDLINCYSLQDLFKLKTKLINSKELELLLTNIIKNKHYFPECTMKGYTILSKLKSCNFDLLDLIGESKKSPDDVKNSIAMCIEKKSNSLNLNEEKYVESYLDYIIEISQPWSNDSLRSTASNILIVFEKEFVRNLREENLKFVIKFSKITLDLLMDEDSTIRDNISNMVLRISTELNPDFKELKLDTIASTYAQELFLETMVIILIKENKIELIENIFKQIINYYSNIATRNKDETEIFDRNEINDFAEALKVVNDCQLIFFKHFNYMLK